MMGLWLMGWVALAGGPGDVVEDLGSGMRVNWTQMRVEVTSYATSRPTDSMKTTEEVARRHAEIAIRQGSERVRVTDDLSLSDLLSQKEFAEPIEARIGRWTITESHYYASGRIAVVGELPLLTLLKPWAVSRAHEIPETATPSAYTGVILDARGHTVRPAWSLRIESIEGASIYDGWQFEDDAVRTTSVVYVSDMAHPAAQRAGEQPLVLSVSAARGSRLVLDETTEAQYASKLASSDLPGQGRWVVLVDP